LCRLAGSENFIGECDKFIFNSRNLLQVNDMWIWWSK